MGDEGKGRVVHEIMDGVLQSTGQHVDCVMKVNGGANAGHTAAGLKLNLLPSGVSNPEVTNLLIGSGVVADPRKFHWEAKPLEAINISVYPRLRIDQRCQVSDLTHRLLDLSWESYRVNQLGQQNRGSTARGISPAYNDETGQWQIFFSIFTQDRKIFANKFRERIARALDTIKYVCKITENEWFSFFDLLSKAESNANHASVENGIFSEDEFSFEKFKANEPFMIDAEKAEEIYWEAGVKLRDCITDGRKTLLNSLDNGRSVLAEFGQSYWLDKRHGFTPNVTASHTFGAEFFMSAGIPLQSVNQVGCCKAYDTKVGTHHFITKLDPSKSSWAQKLSKLEFGTSTGRQRMVGWFDAVEKGNALKYGGFDELVINKLDALTIDRELDGKIKICTAYKYPDGELTLEVPRDEHARVVLTPVYEEFSGWSEDITNVRAFKDLPENAKIYVSRMITSVIEVAYSKIKDEASLPNVRFIGVGPDPRQIISDVPKTYEFIKDRNQNR